GQGAQAREILAGIADRDRCYWAAHALGTCSRRRLRGKFCAWRQHTTSHCHGFAPWRGSIASVMAQRMETKPTPLLVASLLSSGGNQTLFHLTLATALIIAVMIFVTAFLLGLWCGSTWRRRRRWSRAAGELKRRARA